MVGEGKSDCAFLNHLKTLYVSRGCGTRVKIKNAHGKGPMNVVNFAIRQCREIAYDHVVTLFDSDLELDPSLRRSAVNHNIQLVISAPCLEGLLLKILGEHVPNSSDQCKALLGKSLPDRILEQDDYRETFPKSLLETRRVRVPELNKLLNYFPASIC